MFILIVGAGRVGSAVAKRALDAGHDVSVLDSDPLSHERLDKDQLISWEDAGGRFTVGAALEVAVVVWWKRPWTTSAEVGGTGVALRTPLNSGIRWSF